MVYFLIFLAQFVLLFFLSKTLTRSFSLIIFRITKNESHAIRIFHFLFLPGVIIHELSHLLSARIMLVHTSGLNLSPERIGNEIKMGSVSIQKTDPVRRAIIGFAPVLVGFLFISLTTFYLMSEKSPFSLFISYLFVFVIVFEIGNTMFSSKKDLEGTLELLIFIALLVVLAIVLGFKLPDVNAFLNQNQMQEIIIKGIKILSIPIIIDGMLIFFAKFIFNAKS